MNLFVLVHGVFIHFIHSLIGNSTCRFAHDNSITEPACCLDARSVMEDPSYDMLLGLDMLRKHQASIDLSGNCLRIGGTSTPFLPEHKIPRNMRTMGDGQSPPEANSRGDGGSAVSVGSPGQNGSAAQGSATSAGMDPLRAAESRLHRAKIENLMNLGFSSDESEQALRTCNGNEEQAAAMLAQERYGF
jgi:DNA damage-inducible protein 1